MPLVKVWNDNVHPHKERFRGDLIVIEPKGFVEMEWEDAIQFKGQFTPMTMAKPDGHRAEDDDDVSVGGPDARCFKMIRVETVRPELVFKSESTFINPVTGQKHASKAEYQAALRELAEERPDLVAAKDPDAERRDAALHAENADLKERLAALEAKVDGQLARAKPGPKPKVAVG